MIVLDTNVVSELIRPKPAREVCDWVDAQTSTDLFVTAVSQAEMLLGVLILPAGRRRNELQMAIQTIYDEDFPARVLPFDSNAAHAFAHVVAQRRQACRPIGFLDAQIASIARSKNASIATRNTKDFTGCGVTVIDPWRA